MREPGTSFYYIQLDGFIYFIGQSYFSNKYKDNYDKASEKVKCRTQTLSPNLKWIFQELESCDFFYKSPQSCSLGLSSGFKDQVEFLPKRSL